MRGLAIVAVLLTSPAHANAVERACIAAGRAPERELCTCIGVAAQLTLNDRDQRIAAEFFSDPQAAQDTRMSDRRRDEAFWQRYLSFGQMAEDMCG
ncbi:MAG: hypothetical protein AAF689_12175 [Pseudomonadota bacterium]